MAYIGLFANKPTCQGFVLIHLLTKQLAEGLLFFTWGKDGQKYLLRLSNVICTCTCTFQTKYNLYTHHSDCLHQP